MVKPTTPGSQPPEVNEKVATSDRTPSVMTARLEYLWEIMDHARKRKDHLEMNVRCFRKICLHKCVTISFVLSNINK